jgi:SPP1 family holin
MDKDVAIRAAVALVVTVNAVLVMVGLNPIPLAENELYQVLSALVEMAVIVWVWWKNNSVTKAAKCGDALMHAIKSGQTEVPGDEEGTD